MDEVVSRELTRKVSADIQAAILPILEKHGLKLSKFSSKYGDMYGLSISASPTVLDKNGVNLASTEAIYYERFGHNVFKDGEIITLTAKLGTKFTTGGKSYIFCGVRSRGKNKIVVKGDKDGKGYVFADSIIPTLNKVKA